LNEKDYKILYGGSVKAENYKQILDLDDVDGLLIGGASVNIDEFNKILKF
jgi:triosephosphate isomerase